MQSSDATEPHWIALVCPLTGQQTSTKVQKSDSVGQDYLPLKESSLETKAEERIVAMFELNLLSVWHCQYIVY